jgi:hypothetical protein
MALWLALALAPGGSVEPAASTTARTGIPHRGFNFTAWGADEYAGSPAHDSLRRLAATGANAVAIIPTWYQRSRRATRIQPDADLSPTDQSIAVTVARARELSLRVFLRPIVDTEDGAPRASIEPRSVSAWFRSYRGFIYHYARLAERLDVDMLSVGLEYRSLDGPARTPDWRRVIRGVRARFHGRLTYGANGPDAWTRIGFWDALDVIGIDAYFPLSSGPIPREREIVRRWSRFSDRFGATHRYLREMAALARRRRKPIVLTELGYPSAAHALSSPWATGGRFSGEAQRRAFRAAFRALSGRRWFRGVYIWDWSVDPLAGGRGDTGHTPQGKPAERVIRKWFRGSSASARSR